MKKCVRKIAVSLLVIICAVCLACGVTACSARSNTPVETPDLGTTVRGELPTDGSKPTEHTALENVSYMATVLDGRSFYHSYAKNSTKSTGYEQVTQTWKDFKTAEVSGLGHDVMVSSDLSYSALIKSSSQSCYVDGEEAYVRSGSKPAKNSVPTDVKWSEDQPSYYDKDAHLVKYGEFATELSVYIINDDTIIRADSVVDNKDGTYSQKLYLNEGAAGWYKYGMKTRGGLKSYPEFDKIEITFTFDANWTIIRSYCEESAVIAPGALGGMKMNSSSKTTTEFAYGENDFDNAHFGYYGKYFEKYVGTSLGGGESEENPDILELLGNGFSGVVDPNGKGQQFDIYLTLGDNDYSGKLYAKLGDMGDVLGSLDVRFQIGRDGYGQELYGEFRNGGINVYYGEDFALKAGLSGVSAAVGKITDWVNGFTGKLDAQTLAFALTGDEEGAGGLDLSGLLNSLETTFNGSSACVKLKSDNLLGLGVGLNVQIYFNRYEDENGGGYTFDSLYLNSVSYNSQAIKVSGTVVPDNKGETISRNPSDTPADLADFINGVAALLDSESYSISIALDGSCESIDYIKGLKLNATAQAALDFRDGRKQLSVSLPAEVSYNGLSVKLNAYYRADFATGGYGDVYLHITEICGKAVDAKVYCNIDEVTDAVKRLLAFFNGGEHSSVALYGAEEERTVADVVNAVIGLNFGAIITDLKANENYLGVTIDADEILTLLGIDTGIAFGKVKLGVALAEGVASLEGELPALGLSVGVEAGGAPAAVPDKTKFADVTAYINGVTALLKSNSYSVNISLDGSASGVEYLKPLSLSADARLRLGHDFKNIEVSVPLEATYGNLSVRLSAYYTVNLDNGGYGEVYLNVYGLTYSGREIDASAKIYCDIDEVVGAVKNLINKFSPAQSAAAYASQRDSVADIVGVVLGLDYAEIIEELKADGEKISLSVDADEIVAALGVDLGGTSLGIVNLGLGLDGDGVLVLDGAVPELGLTLCVSGSADEITVPDKNEYADLAQYIDGVTQLLESESFEVDIALDGSCESIPYIKGLVLNATASVSLGEDFKDVQVNLPLSVTYDNLYIGLSVYYTVNLGNGGYGEVYLDLDELAFNGEKQCVSAKIYCDIDEVVNAVKTLINKFAPAGGAAAYAVQRDTVADVVDKVLNLDFAAIIEKLKADADGFGLAINADEILAALGVDLGGVSLGTVALSLGLDGQGRAALSGSLQSLGLALSVCGGDGEVSAPDKDGYADLAAYINGVNNLLESAAYRLEINLDGTTDIKYLNGLTLNAAALLKTNDDFSQISVSLPVTAGYGGLCVELSIYYNINLANGDYGVIYLSIDTVNGKPLGARVTCDIKDLKTSVEELINLITSADGNAADAEEADKVSDIIGLLTSLDYASILKQLKADAEDIKIVIDADEILGALGVDLGGIRLGEVTLRLGIDGRGAAVLGGEMPGLGLTLSLCGDDGEVSAPEGEYLDLVELVELVKAAYLQADAIIKNQDAEFVLNTVINVDGIEFYVDGRGEVIWKDGAVRVAVSAKLAITDTDKELPNSNALDLSFVYDGAATGETPVVRLAINKLGLEIRESDLTATGGKFDAVMSSVNNIISAFSPAQTAAAYSASTAGAEDYSELIGSVLEVLGNITIKLEDKNIILGYAADGSLTLTAEGGLGLDLTVGGIADVNAFVRAGDGGVTNGINALLDGEEYVYYTDENSFIKAVYNYVFAVFEDLTVGNVLGSDTYTVELNINGTESGIAALDGINVAAKLYYTEKENKSKLVEVGLDLNINGTAVQANARYFERNIYVTLTAVGDTKLDGVAFKAAADDIYAAAETLVDIITSETLAEIVAKISGDVGAAQALALDTDGEAGRSLSSVIGGILSLDFENLFKHEKLETGENAFTISPDGIFELLGSDIRMGVVEVTVNPVTHEINASATKGGIAWLTLGAKAVADSGHGAFSPEGYIDVGFVANLLEDLYITLEDTGRDEHGALELLYSFTGNIKVSLVNIVDIKLNDITLTLGLDGGNNFYFTLKAYLESSVATSARWISVTYSGGYVTFGRDVDGDNAIYKVMTVSYLLDNLLNKDNSPVRWLLGTNNTLWGIICNNVKLPADFGSGLTNTEILYLYEALNGGAEETPPATGEEENKLVSLSDYIKAFAIKRGGASNVYGDTSDLISRLELSDNYYAFDLDLTKLIGSTLSKIYAAIVSEQGGGLKGVAAYAEIDSYVKITAKLDSGMTKAHAGNYFGDVCATYNIDFDYYKNYSDRIFGCYNTENASGAPYVYSEINKPCNLNVYGLEGELIYNKTLNSGSTVYLLEEECWLDEEQTRKLIYVDAAGNDLGLVFTVTANIDIYQTIVGKKLVNFLNEDGNKIGESAYLSVGAPLENPSATIEGKTFAGWYTENSFINNVSSVPFVTEQEIDLYAKYVNSVEYGANGIKYTFVYENGGYYRADGLDKNRADRDYSLVENTLVIADVINGYPVTKIGASAFKSSDTGLHLKNVVVPATVTEIGAQAFMDNYGMQSVVILGEVVHLYGGSYTDDGNRFVFFGCSDEDDGTTSSLRVYYNEFTVEDNENWNGFRQKKEGGFLGMGGTTVNYKLEQGKNLFPAGAWSYVSYEILGGDFTAEQLGLGSFVTLANDYDYAGNAEHVRNAINAVTAEGGYINAYDVAISGEITLSGATVLTVTLTPAARWFSFTLASTTNNCTVAFNVAETEKFGSVTYVKAGAEITLSTQLNGAYEFDYWQTGDGEIFKGNTFVMPESAATVTAYCKAAYADNVYVYSAVDYSYEGMSYAAGELRLENAVINHTLETPVAVGNYSFLGWALADGDSLGFVGGDGIYISESTSALYYAVWAVGREEAVFGINTEGNLPSESSVSINADMAEGLYGWYAEGDTAFEHRLDGLDTRNTVLYARLDYRFEMYFVGNDSKFNVSGEFNDTATVGTYKLGFTVTEGRSVNINLVPRSGKYIFTDYNWNDCVITYNAETTVSAHKNGNDNNKNRRTFTINSVTRGSSTEQVNVTTGKSLNISGVNGNVTVNATY